MFATTPRGLVLVTLLVSVRCNIHEAPIPKVAGHSYGLAGDQFASMHTTENPDSDSVQMDPMVSAAMKDPRLVNALHDVFASGDVKAKLKQYESQPLIGRIAQKIIEGGYQKKFTGNWKEPNDSEFTHDHPKSSKCTDLQMHIESIKASSQDGTDNLQMTEKLLAHGCVDSVQVTETYIWLASEFAARKDFRRSRKNYLNAQRLALTRKDKQRLGGELGSILLDDSLALQSNYDFEEAYRTLRVSIELLEQAGRSNIQAQRKRLRAFVASGNSSAAYHVYNAAAMLFSASHQQFSAEDFVQLSIDYLGTSVDCLELNSIFQHTNKLCLGNGAGISQGDVTIGLAYECQVLCTRAEAWCAANDDNIDFAMEKYNNSADLLQEMYTLGLMPVRRHNDSASEISSGIFSTIEHGLLVRSETLSIKLQSDVRSNSTSFNRIAKTVDWDVRDSIGNADDWFMTMNSQQSILDNLLPPVETAHEPPMLVEHLDGDDVMGLSISNFRKAYIVRNRPVLFDYNLTGLKDLADADTLVAKYGDMEVNASVSLYEGSRSMGNLTLRSFIRRSMLKAGSLDMVHSSISATHPLFMEIGGLQGIPLVPFFPQEDQIIDLLIGPALAGTAPAKVGFTAGKWEAMIAGIRRWFLWPAFCSFDETRLHGDTALDWITKYMTSGRLLNETCSPMLFDQSAGQVLYVPAGWGCATVNLAASLSVGGNVIQRDIG